MFQRSLATVVVCLIFVAFAQAGNEIDWPLIDGAHLPQNDRMISGQPTPDELVRMRQAGLEHVLNARAIGEFDAWDEAALVESLGMTYHRVPIGSTDDLDHEAVRAFDRILAEIGSDPALLHCASGNRIGALYALRAAWIQGRDAESAIEIGKAHGLTSLEAAVRKMLGAES